MARLSDTVLADGVVYPAGTEHTQQLGEKIPAEHWDGPLPESKQPARKAKSE